MKFHVKESPQICQNVCPKAAQASESQITEIIFFNHTAGRDADVDPAANSRRFYTSLLSETHHSVLISSRISTDKLAVSG